MRRRDLVIYGQTNKDGGFMISNKQDMQEYFKQWKNSFFTMTIEVTKTTPLSVPLIVYYKKKIVPDMQRALLLQGERLTLKQTDEKLRAASPLTIKEVYNEELRKWESSVIDLEDLDNQQLVFFIEHLKDLAAQEYGVYVEDPNNLI